MYIGGIPVGMLVDHKGPRPGVFTGGGLLAIGYFSMYRGMSVRLKISAYRSSL